MIELGQGQWNQSNIQVFWGEIAPCDHLVQFYENDKTFLNTLEGFVGDGFLKGDSVVIIATPEHLASLTQRLEEHNFPLDELIATDRFIPLDAEESLAKFMVNGWPDERLFSDFVATLLAKAVRNGQTVRAFGEMVALLWEQGHNGATVQLENLWHRFQQVNDFCLFCAYPKSGFTQDASASLEHICRAHSMVIDGAPHPSTEIYYHNIPVFVPAVQG